MAEITTTYTTGSNLYFIVTDSAGQYWNTTTPAFEAYNAANIGVYDCTDGNDMTEDAGIGVFRYAFPSGATGIQPGRYEVFIKLRAGGSPAVADVTVGGGSYTWDATSLRTPAAADYEGHSKRSIVVADAATDALRGDELRTAYAAAVALTPTSKDRVSVLIPPGRYDVAGTPLAAATDYVDLIAMKPEKGGDRTPEDVDNLLGNTSLDSYRPTSTVVFTTTADTQVVVQSCNVMKAVGFTVANLAETGSQGAHGWYVSASENQGSEYDKMYFWMTRPSYPSGEGGNGSSAVSFIQDVCGTWRDCVANAYAWRVGRRDSDLDSQFSATMTNCQGGFGAFIGDYTAQNSVGTYSASGCRVVNCHSIGQKHTGATGEAFSGCGAFSLPIDSDCYFEDCTSKNNSFGLLNENAGTFIRCQGGNNSFAGNEGTFSGYAEDCIGGNTSFGGNGYTDDAGRTTGTLVRCKVIATSTEASPWILEGATIEDCLFATAATGAGYTDCFVLNDSLSRIHNSTILVVEGGTGIPINAASAQSVSAVGNRYNNVSEAAADGLGANVTNTGTTNDVTTDAASRTASKADVEALATAAALVTVDGNVDAILVDTETTLPGLIENLAPIGEGAYTGTLTVDNGEGVGLEGATVQARRGGVLKASGTTNSSGQITDWVFGAYTYALAVRLAGYQPGTDTIAATDAWTKTVSLTAISISSPSATPLCTVGFTVKLSDTEVSGAVCKSRLLGINQASDGTILSNAESSDTTDANGVAELALVRKSAIVKGDGRYKIWVEIAGQPVANITTTIPDQGSISFEDLL